MRTYCIDVSYDSDDMRDIAPEQTVVGVLEQVLEKMDQDSCECSVRFVSDDTMQQLNKEYRDKDEPTDILSFVQQDDVQDFLWPELDSDFDEGQPSEISILGDMVISLDTLKRNALSFSVEPDEELFRVLIHGLLHLLGEDHATNDMDEPMLQQQEQLLLQVRGSKR